MLERAEIYTRTGLLLQTFYMTSGRYPISDVDGLEPVPAIVTSSAYAGLDGEVIQSARLGRRNIVFRLGLKPSYQNGATVQGLRKALYRALPPKRDIVVRLFDDEYPVMEIDGTVESNTPAIFSADPSVTLSIICGYPLFRGMSKVVMPMTLNSGRTQARADFVYEGDAPTGFQVVAATASSTVTALAIANGVDTIRLSNAGFAFPISTRYTVSTVRGAKTVNSWFNGTTTTNLDLLSSGSLSTQIQPETTTMYVTATGGILGTCELSFMPMYLGV